MKKICFVTPSCVHVPLQDTHTHTHTYNTRSRANFLLYIEFTSLRVYVYLRF